MILEAGDWLLAQAAAPAVDGKFVLYVVLRVLHILSAMIIVGGLFYAKAVLIPVGADPYAGNRQAWARWVGIASLFLLVSGLLNFMNNIGLAKEHGTPLPPTYHMLFGIKFLLGLFVLFIAAILAGKTTLADKFRQNLGHWLNIALVASFAIVVIGALLRTFPR
jgi:uncharacterized membrane protein